MPTSDWMPVVADVGNRLRARTKDTNGNEVGTFTADTRPTDQQCQALVLRATADVAMRVGAELPSAVWDDARSVASVRAAMLVEMSYFPEQIGTANSPYAQLKALYDDDIKSLILAVEAAGGDVIGNDPGAPLPPQGSFPMTGDPYIIGRGTAW